MCYLQGMTTAHPKFYRCLDHPSAVMCATVWNSLNLGNLLISGSTDKTLRLWDLDNELCTNILHGHTDAVVCVCVSPPQFNDPVIVSGSVDKLLIQWSLEHGNMIRELKGHRGIVNAVSISADMDLPVIVSSSVDNMIICWKVSDGSQIGMIHGHDGPISALALSHIRIPVIISGGDDKMLRVWDLSTGSLIETLKGQDSEINALAVSKNPMNPIIVSGASDGSLFVWDLLRLKLLYVLLEACDAENSDAAPGSWEISSVAVSDSPQSIIISTTWTSAAFIWDAKTGGLLRILDAVHTRRLSSVCIGRDEVGPVIITSGHDGKVVVWSPEEDLLSESISRDFLQNSTVIQNDSSRNYLVTHSKIRSMSLEESIVLAGKYLYFWNLLISPASGSAESEEQDRRIRPQLAAVIFYCLLRLGRVNPQMVRVKAIALNDILVLALPVVDLLLNDPILYDSPVQFLIDNKLCLQRTYEWMKISTNIERVITTLADPHQSSDTLDSILTAVVNDELLGGWDLLLSHAQFESIFKNLIVNSKRSHKKIALMLQAHGMGVESEPFPSPLDVPRNREKIVVRWNQVKQGVGIYCYRIRVNFALPMDFLLSFDFLEAISESDDVNHLVTVPLIEFIIQYKWESWGSHMTRRLGIFYFLYLSTTTASVLTICTGGYEHLSQHKIYVGCVAISVICNTFLMGLEFWQWTKAKSSMKYFSNLWHVSDWAMILLCHLSIIVGTMLGPVYIVRIMCTVLTLLLWSRTLYFGRGEEDLSILIHTLKVIIWDVRYFVFILFLFLCAFAVSFRVLGIFDDLPMSFMRLFNMLYGDLGYDINFRNREIPTLMYVVFLICVVIILLNSLIAFMENSFLFATNTRKVAALVSRLRMLTELEIQSLPFIAFHSALYGVNHEKKHLGDLVVLSPETIKKPDFSPILPDSEKLGRIDSLVHGTLLNVEELRSTLEKRNTETNQKIASLEHKIVNMEDKLDRILSWISTRESEQQCTMKYYANTSNSSSEEPSKKNSDSRIVAYSYFGEGDEHGN
jgi:WD40 repeat protein